MKNNKSEPQGEHQATPKRRFFKGRGSSHYIDQATMGWTLSFTGWLFNPDRKIVSVRAFVARGDITEFIPVQYGGNRPDVFAAHKVDAALSSGIRAKSLPLWTGGTVGLHISFQDNQGDEVLTLFQIQDGPDGVTTTPSTRSFSGVVIRPTDLPLYQKMKGLPLLQNSRMAQILRIIDKEFTPPRQLPEKVTLLVPVYRGKHFLLPFFDSLFLNTYSPYRLIIIDDGNDDPEILEILDRQKDRGAEVVLVRQPENSGFAKAVTRGFQLWQGGHMVLINTDTVLPPYWLERLVWPLFDEPTIGSATPSSNCATICGFPEMPEDNPLCFDLDAMVIDETIRCIHPGQAIVDIPSGVGFCMALGEGALRDIGFFDADTFTRGYGEENDWSLRAAARGYRNVHVPNLFVYHKHGGSYLPDEKRKLMENSLGIIEARYPGYQKQVQDYIAIDPLANLRAVLAVGLAAQAHSDQGAILVIGDRRSCEGGPWVHGIGECRDEDRPVIWTRFSPHSVTWDYVLDWPGGQATLTGDSLAELPALCELARVGLIVIANPFSSPFPLPLCRVLTELAAKTPLTVIADDPRLVEGDGLLLVDGALDPDNLPSDPAGKLALWRSYFLELLRHAEVIWCSNSENQKALFAAYPALHKEVLMVADNE